MVLSRFALVVLLVLGIVLSPLRAVAAAIPVLIAYGAAATPTAQPSNTDDPAFRAGAYFGQALFWGTVLICFFVLARKVLRSARAASARRPGTPVLVQWADGNRYPATIRQPGPLQSLVVLSDGREIWVEHRYLHAPEGT